jgi:methyl-accepting chemotaxis protein
MIAITLAMVLAVGLGFILARIIGVPVKNAAAAAAKLATGDVNVQIAGRETKDEIGMLGKAFTVLVARTKEQAEAAHQISAGNLSVEVTPRSGEDVLGTALQKAILSLRGLVAEAGMLSKAAVEGKLATRGNAEKFQGSFREIVQGVNDTLDSVIGPLNVAAEYVDRISKGDIPAKITDTYNGDFNEIKNNLNQAIGAVNALVADATLLAKAAVEGKLATRADASKHGGDFRKIVQGVNDTLDSVIGPLNVAAEYVDRISKGDIPAKITDNYNGDFNEIKNNLNQAIGAVTALVVDAHMLSRAAVEGKLATRADASKHQGDFRKIVQGVNETLDSVIGPLNVAAEYVDVMATGDMTARMNGDYRGDLQLIKESINKVGGSLQDALRKVSEAVSATASASSQISSSTEEMAAGAQEQTSQAGEVASAV